MNHLTRQQRLRLRGLESQVRYLTRIERRSQTEERKLGNTYREAIRLYKDFASCNPPFDDPESLVLQRLASQAMTHLGGEGDLCSVSLKEYDYRRYGPYLGVSDEGSAAPVIRRAGLSSPKALAFNTNDPLIVGVAVDAERLGGIGEVAVGPEEYVKVRLECAGRILSSTNVGTRVNLRFYRRHPVVKVQEGSYQEALEQAQKDIRAMFEPFLQAPGGRPRPLTVFVEFERRSRRDTASRISIIKELLLFAERPDVSDSSIHQLGYQVRIGPGKRGRDAAIRAIDIAKAAGIKDVAILGFVRSRADELLSFPGLVSYLSPGMLGPVLRHAIRQGVKVRPVNTVDPDTVARHVWSSLHTARQMGYELGKYGLFPLTLEESSTVIAKIQAWFSDWTAAPVFFVDQGLLSATRVDTHGDLLRGLKTWLQMVAKHNVPVVLIDTIEKAKRLPLLRSREEPRGFMSYSNLVDIERLAQKLGIRVLWAGGITLPQAFYFGQIGVFGVYVTSAAASPAKVPPEYERDYWLAVVKEPSFEGVFRTKLLLEAGFLSVRLRDRRAAVKIRKAALALIAVLPKKDENEILKHQKILADLLIRAWPRFRPESIRRNRENFSIHEE